MNKLLAALALAGSMAAQAQTPAAAPASPPASAAKKELALKLVALQQGSLEQLARNLVEQPARQLMIASEQVLRTRVAADKREATGKQVQDEVRKYLDDAGPLVRERALKLGPQQLAPAFEEKFSEDELRQIVAFYESPANKKLQQVMPEVSKGLTQTLVTDSRPAIEPKIKALEATLARVLGVPPPGGAASAPASVPAAAAKPAPASKTPAASASKP